MNEQLWKEVIKGKIVINCETYEELIQYLDFINEKGYKCILGLTTEIKAKTILGAWNKFTNDSCIRLDKYKNFHFNSKRFYKESDKISGIAAYKELMRYDALKEEKTSPQILFVSDTKDNVNNPSHYNQGKYETIDVIKSVSGKGFESYLVGNIIKYISRYKFKNGVEDLEKAQWYLDKLIEVNKNE